MFKSSTWPKGAHIFLGFYSFFFVHHEQSISFDEHFFIIQSSEDQLTAFDTYLLVWSLRPSQSPLQNLPLETKMKGRP